MLISFYFYLKNSNRFYHIEQDISLLLHSIFAGTESPFQLISHFYARFLWLTLRFMFTLQKTWRKTKIRPNYYSKTTQDIKKFWYSCVLQHSCVALAYWFLSSVHTVASLTQAQRRRNASASRCESGFNPFRTVRFSENDIFLKKIIFNVKYLV